MFSIAVARIGPGKLSPASRLSLSLQAVHPGYTSARTGVNVRRGRAVGRLGRRQLSGWLEGLDGYGFVWPGGGITGRTSPAR